MTNLQDTTTVSTDTPQTVTAQAGAVVENHFSPVIQNNITIQAPTAAQAPARRRSGGSARHSGRSEQAAAPTAGFRLDTPTANVEAMRAQQEDEGQRNVEVRIEAQRTAYEVREETRRRPGSNDSLQSAGAVADAVHGANSRAFVSSTQGRSLSMLEGYANGTVILTHQQNGITLRTDITGASRDITASGIRLLQQNIVADGEVDRVEQQQIINLVQQARELAAARQ